MDTQNPSTRRAVIFVHEEMEGPGQLAPALRRAGFQLETRLRKVEPGDVDADLVVVMGGPMGVYEADQHPYLTEELMLLRRRLEERRPNLGICLGAQLIAAAAGSNVYKGRPGMVVGVLPVTLTPEGLADPLFAGFDERFETVHWHGDTFDPIPGSVLLASSARYPQQAFRLNNSFGVQFHPELDPPTYERWLKSSADELSRAGRSIEDTLERDLPKLKATLHPNMLLLERLSRFFAKEVGAGGSGERYLFTVENAVRLEDRGVILAPGIPRRTPIVRIGEPIALARPDGTRVTGTVRGMAAFGAEGPSIPLLISLDDPGAEIPSGSDAVTSAPLDKSHP